jgi:hypothetical protein
VLITKNPFDFIWWMIFKEPSGILQEVAFSLNMIIHGCNSTKKLISFKIKVATPCQKV